MASEQPGPNGVGSDTWPGLSQLAADAAQIVARVGAIVGSDAPEDTAGLRACLQDELGDLRAAIDYVVGKNALDWDAVNRRRDRSRSLLDRAANANGGNDRGEFSAICADNSPRSWSRPWG